MKKDRPELYELLKTNKTKLGSISSSDAKEEVATYTAPASSEPAPIPYNQPSSTASKVYPKLKMPFPTNIKGFHPIAKPKEQTFSRPSTPDKTFNYQTQEKKTPTPQRTMEISRRVVPVNYRKFVIPVIIVAALIIVVYLIFGQSSQNKQPTVPNPNTIDTNNIAPVTPDRLWSNQLVYYKNNAEGQRSTEKILKFLNDKGIQSFTKTEQIQGASCTVVYAGKFRSVEDAKKEQPKLKRLHHAFRNLQAVELGEK
ncbi:MAG: hypothetical protein V1709_02055 [Planctomycetota bacterium]